MSHRLGAPSRWMSVCLFAAAAVAVPAFAADVVDGNFENHAYTVGSRPTTYGVWQGDNAELTFARSGIIPFEGVRMARFINTEPGGPSERLGSELWQLVDIRDQMTLVRTGRALATASAWFDRIDGEATVIDTEFSIGIGAYAGDPSSFPQQWQRTELLYRAGTVFSDEVASTWEKATVSMTLPANTDFLVIHLRANENVVNDLNGTEFHGHFVDAVTFRIQGPPSQYKVTVPTIPKVKISVPTQPTRPGSSTTVIINNAEPSATVYLFAGRTGAGSTFVPELGVTLGIDHSILVGTTVSDVEGRARWSARVPKSTPLGIIWIEAAQPGQVSNIATLRIE